MVQPLLTRASGRHPPHDRAKPLIGDQEDLVHAARPIVGDARAARRESRRTRGAPAPPSGVRGTCGTISRCGAGSCSARMRPIRARSGGMSRGSLNASRANALPAGRGGSGAGPG